MHGELGDICILDQAVVVALKLLTLPKYSEAVVKDLAQRSETVQSTDLGAAVEVRAVARMSNLMGYGQILQELTELGETFSTTFENYQVPKAKAQETLISA